MTRHPDAGVLAEYREGLLGRRRSARIQAHLAGCPSCAATGEGLAGVTALLAGSPAPSMPSDVIARLDSALAAEVAARPQATDGVTAGPGHGGTARAGNGAAAPAPGGTEPQPDRSGQARPDGHGWWPGRRPARPAGPPRRPALLGAAAAAAIVLAGAGYGLASLTNPAGGGSASSGTAAGAAGGSAGGPEHPAADGLPASAMPVTTSGTDFQPGTLARQAQALLPRHATGHFTINSGISAGPENERAIPAGRAATPRQRACVLLVTGGVLPQVVDIAHYQGQPATIIVRAPSGGKPGQVWVAGPACSAQHRDILAQTSLPGSG